MPKYPLTGVNITAGNYVDGKLETWTNSALKLNGQNQYAQLTNADIRKDITYPTGDGRQGVIRGSRKKTADMDNNNFLLEVYLKADQNHTGGWIIGKSADAGYVMELDQTGKVRLRLRSGGADVAKRTSAVAINDGAWHHVIAEVDRSAAQGIRIYIDGKVSNGAFEGIMPTGSLSNTADLLLGGGPGKTHFAGAFDFLRISRGTLADAKTTIEELYAWQFTSGPQFCDITGTPLKDNHRDAGAFEGDSTHDSSVRVKKQPVIIGKAAHQVVTTLKAAAEAGIQSGVGIQNGVAVNMYQLSSSDTVEVLLNSKTKSVTNSFTVPIGGKYSIAIQAAVPVKVTLQRVVDDKVSVIAVSENRKIYVTLEADQDYVYTLDFAENPKQDECTIIRKYLP